MMKARKTKLLKKRKKKRNAVDIPEDLIREILLRVPATSLVRLLSISKGWNALIKDEKFAKNHYAYAPRQSLVIMLVETRVYLVSIDLHGIDHNNAASSIKVSSQLNPLFNSSEQVHVRNIFHCDGLLLCSTKDNRLVIWNPCSSETRWIKPRKTYRKFDFFAVGKSSCNKYKILRVDQFGYLGPCHIEYEVYDFTSNSWRYVGESDDWFIPRIKSRGITVNGNTYWLGFSHQDILLCFDFSTERFVNVSFPGDHLSHAVFALSVTREEQQLCMLANRSWDIDVWIATKIDESTGAASWIKLVSVMEQTYRPFCFSNGMNFLADLENEVIVCPSKDAISNDFLNIMGKDKCIQVNHHDVGSKLSLLVTYVPSLVQIQ